ncbi:MAG TPA: UDP-3-O-(3-hydroxymyristoyl)glucosamine N-acyltransferase [Thermoanaerobaculaceae bacterium]|mgnify:CR=1 FL=1|nr:UDP-3-O-(3-hydroxymyristoyl)glucosamine N-acyltransferase [Thermoanaerobaculaceae bacterium]HRS15774.1 UDP-3-O-(3-hydroxymyristoyl)glucosamine N-acyltransferase [Thermoanaerobaculaceae bacterium]
MPSVTLGELARRLDGAVVGDAGLVVTGVRPLGDAGPEHLSFYHNRRYLHAARQSRAGALLVASAEGFAGRNLLVVKQPYAALADVLEFFHPLERPPAGVHPTAVVADSAEVAPSAAIGPHAVVGERAAIGEGAVVGAGCYVGDDAVVGAETWLHPHVVIEPQCRVGARCILHAGVVVGSDGFGFATVEGEHRKVPQTGIVVIEDDVELGANVCVDRATLGETRIGRGSKVDNLVQIAHNVRVGEGCLLVSQSGISGSTELGRHVVMAGQSGAVGHIRLAERTVVTAKTGVTEDTEPGSTVSGFPSRPHREWLKAMAHLYQIDDLRRRIAELEKALMARSTK